MTADNNTCHRIKKFCWQSNPKSPGLLFWVFYTLEEQSFQHLCVVALDDLTPASVHSLWSSPKFLNQFFLTILIRLRVSRLVVHLFLPHFFLPLNFLLTCLDTALCEQPASLVMNVCGLPSLWRVSMIVFWTTVRSAVFPVIVSPSEQNRETTLKAQETFAGVLSWLADWHVTIF